MSLSWMGIETGDAVLSHSNKMVKLHANFLLAGIGP